MESSIESRTEQNRTEQKNGVKQSRGMEKNGVKQKNKAEQMESSMDGEQNK
jgi:hypothetical protein